ncbi:MAG: amidohydrolase [Bacteroidota bacterium]
MTKIENKYRFSCLIVILSLTFSSCYKGVNVDLVIHNARIHTMNEKNAVMDAMAVKDGKIIEVGAEQQILNKYQSEKIIDAKGKDIYPGLTDAHGHILSYINQKLNLDLVGCKSYDEVIKRVEKYQIKKNRKIIIGRGWDQSLWGTNDLPTNDLLNKILPSTPICLYRIDGHAALVNDAMLKLAGISSSTKADGGIIELKENKPTGLLIDNAMNLISKYLPDYPEKEKLTALEEIQNELFQFGITGVHEAGIEFKDIAFFKKYIEKDILKLNLYAMLIASEENIKFAKKNGTFKFKNLSIRSFKVFGDGALGSRGACLKKHYDDHPGHFGMLTTTPVEMQKVAKLCEDIGYQMNTHAIGDSTNSILLKLYEAVYSKNKDHRWRIEHAQVVDPKEIAWFGKFGVFPSVQPTHAVSDQRWAKKRLGEERMKGAYAYKSLLKSYGMLAIGTDFPIELTNPFLTIHAAVQRKDKNNFPADGFYENEAISLEECLKGMTIWAAFASFDENRLGSIEAGKEATFVIFEKPIESSKAFSENFAWKTFIRGKNVYASDEL